MLRKNFPLTDILFHNNLLYIQTYKDKPEWTAQCVSHVNCRKRIKRVYNFEANTFEDFELTPEFRHDTANSDM